MALAKQIECRQPVHVGQLAVQQDQIKIGVQCSQFERPLAVSRFEYFNRFFEPFE